MSNDKPITIIASTVKWAADHDWFNFAGDNGDGTYAIYTTEGDTFKDFTELYAWAGY